MTKQQVTEAVLAGRRIIVGEFRGGYEVKEFPHKTKQGVFNVRSSINLLVADEVVEAGNFIKAARAVDAPPCPFKQGDKLVVEFDAYERTKFGVRVSGNPEPLT